MDSSPIKPSLVTLTGVDAATSPTRLIELSARFPKVEWGVLLGRAESPRYPSIDLVHKWADRADRHHVRMAMHLCGAFAKRWLNNDPEIVELAHRFSRIQVNVVARLVDEDALVEAIRSGRHASVITQHNQANESLTQALMDCEQHAVLFDGSGGRGIAPSSWPLSIPGKRCGYSGGLSKETVATELDRIAPVAKEGYWIDMENRLRTHDDLFDLDLCEQVLGRVADWER